MIFGGNVKIGVLGGIGPEATGEYYLKLIKSLQQSGLIRNNADFPQIIINSIPAPELVGKTISEEQLAPYRTGLKQLDEFGVDLIVMVCNTIHLYHADLQSVVNTPIINLRKKVNERLIRDGIRKAAVLGTPSAINRGLYHFDNIEYTNLSGQDIDDLSQVVFRYNNGTSKTSDKSLVKKIAEHKLQQGAQTIILGCTELAIMLKDADIQKINASDVLVDATVEFFEKHKGVDKNE